MVQRALAGKLETNEEQALQKLDQKRKQKSRHLVIELPELNTVLVEAFGELNHTTHVAKEIARCSTNKNGKWSCGGHEVYSFLDRFNSYNQDSDALGGPRKNGFRHRMGWCLSRL